jgi:hypothetical protein
MALAFVSLHGVRIEAGSDGALLDPRLPLANTVGTVWYRTQPKSTVKRNPLYPTQTRILLMAARDAGFPQRARQLSAIGKTTSRASCIYCGRALAFVRIEMSRDSLKVPRNPVRRSPECPYHSSAEESRPA